jgi:hypothetical protein
MNCNKIEVNIQEETAQVKFDIKQIRFIVFCGAIPYFALLIQNSLLTKSNTTAVS